MNNSKICGLMNNMTFIEDYLDFKNNNNFHQIIILKRRKDNPELKHTVKILKRYSLFSKDDYYKVQDSLRKYVEESNARVYICLNPQNASMVSLDCIKQMSTNLKKGTPKKNIKVWDTVSGRVRNPKYWIIDIDKEHLNYKNDLVEIVKNKIDSNFVNSIKTSTGVHVISKPFNPKQLDGINQELVFNNIPKLQIQKDGVTLLMYNK